MSLFRLALANLLYRKFNAFISIILLAFGVALVSLLMSAGRFLDQTLVNSIQGVDMVVGAKGSPMQLILANVYHIDNPTGNISLKQVDGILRNPLIEKSVKLSYGDYFKEFRILGTTAAFLDFYKLKIESGKLNSNAMEVVIGSEVAEKTGLKPGSKFESAHGEGNGEKHHEQFVVSGILKSSGTVADKLIITSLQSVWMTHHLEEAENKEITAVLVKFRTAMGMMTVPAMINKNSTLMAAVPAIEVNRLLTLFENGFTLLYGLAIIVVAIAVLSVFFSLLNSLRERKFELALLRVQGASRSSLFILISLEAMLIAIFGSIIGLLAGKGIFVGIASMYFGTAGEFLTAMDLILIPLSVLLAFVACILPAIVACRVEITSLLNEK